MAYSVPDAARQIRKEEAARARIFAGAARYAPSFALDSEEATELSAKDLAVKVLRHLGLLERDAMPPSDPVAALEAYFAGKKDVEDRAAGRRSARDSSEGSFLDSYINGGA